MPEMLLSVALQAAVGPGRLMALTSIPHNDCAVDSVGVDGNPACRMWGWYWDGPSPQASEHDEEVGSWTYYGNGKYDYPGVDVGPRKQ